jgi:hypothetical protein
VTFDSTNRPADYITLHIRGIGGWTNRLHQYFTKQSETVVSLRKEHNITVITEEPKTTHLEPVFRNNSWYFRLQNDFFIDWLNQITHSAHLRNATAASCAAFRATLPPLRPE